MALTAPQIDQLLAPIAPSRVQHDNKGMAHLAAWDVRRWLIRIFGPTGWTIETISCDLIFEKETETKAKRPAWYVGYRAQSRLTIRAVDGGYETFFEDGAVGDATLPTLGDAHDMAMKTALSQSLKRCAMNLGDQFGLSLYNNGSPEAVVGKALTHPATPQVKTVEGVEGDTEARVAEEPVAVTVRQPSAAVRSNPAKPKPVDELSLDSLDAVSALCIRMDAAESLPDLQLVAEEIAKMEPKPSMNELKILTEVWKERKASLS